MSSMAALVFSATVTTFAAPPPTALTADQAMAHYQALMHSASGEAGASDCPKSPSSQIVVCGKRIAPPPRLPLPDQRAEAGEVVHHAGEPGAGDPGPPTGPPSRQGETISKLFGLLKSAVTGEDRGF